MKFIPSLLIFLAVFLKLGLGGAPGIPLADLSSCNHVSDFYIGGIYDKSVCYVRTSLSYSDAAQYCIDKGMKIYKIESADDKANLFSCTSTETAFGWIDSTPPLNPTVTPIIPAGGDCIFLNINTFYGYDCSDAEYFFCQYDRNFVQT